MKIRILAVGKLKRGPLSELVNDYLNRLRWNVQISEIDHSAKTTESKELASQISHEDFVVLMDEKGQSMTSQQFAEFIENLQVTGKSQVNFVIGGAEGVDRDLFKGVDKSIAFGVQTWPHMMVRLMLVEQLYRAEQILAGHPYHKA